MTNIELDWVGYFKEFTIAHGGSPVPYKGRLLFQDGWTYSSTDHQGPEWPPPNNEVELRELQRAYWDYRRQVTEQELHDRKCLQTYLDGLQNHKSMPLVQKVRVFDDETQRTVIRSVVVDMGAIESEITWITQQLAECQSKLEELCTT